MIMSIVYAIQLMPIRGKSLHQLNPAQMKRVEKFFQIYMRTRKGKQTPNMQMEEYLPILQKQALRYLIMAIVILPVYVAVVLAIYSPMFFA